MHRGRPKKSVGGGGTTKKSRLNLELDAPTKDRLDSLQVSTEADSMTQVIRKALRLYEIVFLHSQKGGKVVLKDKNGGEETVVLL